MGTRITATSDRPALRAGVAAWDALLAWLRAHAYALAPAALAVLLGALFLTSTAGSQDDDGYIFYQYASNLAAGNGLQFNPGELSFGVTSGGWVLLLAAVHALLRLDIVAEAQWLGLALFALSAALWAWAVVRWTRQPLLGLLAASVYVLELDALKSSLNGLETGLTLALFAAVATLLADERLAHPLLLGAAFGAAVLTRPDNVVLLFAILALTLPQRERLRLAVVGAAAALLALPWYLWLWAASGSPVPPTQTGKLLVFLPLTRGVTLGEYAAWGPLERAGFGLAALLDFVRGGGAPVLVGVASLLGALLLSVVLRRERQMRHLAAWPLALIATVGLQALLYGWSFPLLKLRYLVNLLPVGLVLLIAAAGLLLSRYYLLRRASAWRALRVGALLLLLGAGLLYSREVGRQVGNYRYYVAVQNVRDQVGLWLRENTAPNSLVALEPIGSVGFYADRRILDLGGLTDRSVWPALAHGYADGQAVAALLQVRGADYLIDYSDPQGIGGVSNALPFLPGAAKVGVVASEAALAGARGEYGSYTIYRLQK